MLIAVLEPQRDDAGPPFIKNSNVSVLITNDIITNDNNGNFYLQFFNIFLSYELTNKIKFPFVSRILLHSFDTDATLFSEILFSPLSNNIILNSENSDSFSLPPCSFKLVRN